MIILEACSVRGMIPKDTYRFELPERIYSPATCVCVCAASTRGATHSLYVGR